MYNGFNLKIENNIVPNDIIVPGSYQLTQNPRIADEWEDANGIKHTEYFPTDKASITFNIKARTSEQQNSIKWLFAKKDDLMVTYYDDATENYLTGMFKLNPVALTHSFDGNSVYYAECTIELEEH